MKKSTIKIMLVALQLASTAVLADESVVLIVSKDSNIATISSIELRKLYLGFTVDASNGQPIKVITNATESRLQDIFLQAVMGMSRRSYDRRLLTLTLQSGRQRPAEMTDLNKILLSVHSELNALTFVWRKDIEGRDDIKVLRELWQD